MSVEEINVSIEPDITKQLCALCKKICMTVCDRCGVFYCSTECQLQDWRDHRKKCMPMPSLMLATDWVAQSK